MDIFDDRRCELGEGAFWHPERGQFFWFDILAGRLYSRDATGPLEWVFGERVSAAGWMDRDRLLIAGESGLWQIDLASGARERVAAFPDAPDPRAGAGDVQATEAAVPLTGGSPLPSAPLSSAPLPRARQPSPDLPSLQPRALQPRHPRLRSNDGRADPWGGFWISTMGLGAETAAGAIWRYWRGEFRLLRPGLTIPNAICFDAEREIAYVADTKPGTVWTWALDPATGWPRATPQVFLEMRARDGHGPDGAVIDAEGRFWTAQWGAGRVACYDAAARLVTEERFAARQLSCPAFGGPGFDRLFVTSAQQDMSPAERLAEPAAGMTFARPVGARGLPEPRVDL